MENLCLVIKKCKEGSKNDILDILNKFNPLLNKYARLLQYEDAKQDLILAFINVLYKIPIEKDIFKEDKYIIGYIQKSIIYKYWAISKKKSEKCSHEYEFDFNLIADKNEENILELHDLLRDLTDRERKVIIAKYINKMTDVEIGELNSISRQAVNQAKNRAITKLRQFV